MEKITVDINTLFRTKDGTGYRVKTMYPKGAILCIILVAISDPDKTMQLELVNP
jgi:hypothetical protein